MKIKAILRTETGEEVKGYIYVEGYSWGFDTMTPLEKKVLKTIAEVVKEWGGDYEICRPSVQEVLKGEVNPENYASDYCRSLADSVLREVRFRLRLD